MRRLSVLAGGRTAPASRVSIDRASPAASEAGVAPRIGGSATRVATIAVAAWLGAAWVAAAVLSLVVAPRAPSPALVADVLLTAAPALAAVACLLAGRTVARTLRPAWLLFALAGAAVVLRQFIFIAAIPSGHPEALFPSLSFALLVVAHVGITAGAVMTIPPLRSRAVAGGLLVDLALVLIAGGLFALQLAVEHGGGMPTLSLLQYLGTQLATAATLFVVGLLLVWRAAEMPLVPALGLVTTAVVFALGNTVVTLKVAPAGPGAPLDLLWITGWLALAFAGFSARALRDSLPEREPGRLASIVGGVLIPAGALYVAAMGLSSALAPYVGSEIGLALWFLAAPLAVRVGQGLRAEVRRKAQGQELVHTRALVELNRALTAAVELAPTLELVTRWARKLTNARAAAIQLLSSDEQSLELRAVTGLPPGAVGLVLPVADSFTGAVVRDRHPRVVRDWKRVGAAHPRELALFGEEAGAAAPLLFRERALGVLIVAGCQRPFDREQIAMLSSMADSAAVAIEDVRLFEQIRSLSLIDPLTGLGNRRALERDLAREFAAARRGRLLAAVMFDIDGFKSYNDTHGHLAGDDALRTLGAVLIQETRAMNLAVRYGGDEFVVLLSDADADGAIAFAERTRERFRDSLAIAGEPLDLTYGIATFDERMDGPAELLAAADRALYRGKARVGVSSHPAEQAESSR